MRSAQRGSQLKATFNPPAEFNNYGDASSQLIKMSDADHNSNQPVMVPDADQSIADQNSREQDCDYCHKLIAAGEAYFRTVCSSSSCKPCLLHEQ